MEYSRKIKDSVFHIMRLTNTSGITREVVNDILDGNGGSGYEVELITNIAAALNAITNVHVIDPNEILFVAINNNVNNMLATIDDVIRNDDLNVYYDITAKPVSIVDLKTDLVVLNGILENLDRVLAIFSYMIINMPFQSNNAITALVWLTVALAEAAHGSIIDLGQNYEAFWKKYEQCLRDKNTVPMFLFLKSVYAHLSVK